MDEELDPKIHGVYPDQARKRLDNMGFEEFMWDELMYPSFGSHELRALIIIARGAEPRLLGDVYMEVRKLDGLPPERRTMFDL